MLRRICRSETERWKEWPRRTETTSWSSPREMYSSSKAAIVGARSLARLSSKSSNSAKMGSGFDLYTDDE